MNKTQEKLLNKYADKKEKLEALAEEVKELAGQVLHTLETESIDTLKLERGTYSVVYRKKWIYDDEYNEKELQYETILKSLREEEQMDGRAKAEESKSLSYRKYVQEEK